MSRKYADQSHCLPLPKGTYEADAPDGTTRVSTYKSVWNSTWDASNPPKTDNHYPFYGQVTNRK